MELGNAEGRIDGYIDGPLEFCWVGIFVEEKLGFEDFVDEGFNVEAIDEGKLLGDIVGFPETLLLG